MILSTLQDRVYSVVRDAPRTFITPADVTAWLNEAQTDIVARLKLLQKENSAAMGDAGTSVANGTIDLPSDFIEPISLRLGTTDVDFDVDDETFWAYQDDAATPATTIGRIFGDKLELYPKPATAVAFKLRYVYEPTDLVNAGDSPLIAVELQPKMIRYAQAHAKYKEKEPALADRYMAMYEEGLPSLTPRTRLGTSDLQLVYERGPFD